MRAFRDKTIEFGEFELDTEQKILRRGGEIVSLPLKSVELLCILAENRGEVVTKHDLMQKVWGDAFVEDSVLTQNIYLLRKALEGSGKKNLIKNVPRRGYLFNGEVRAVGENHVDLIVERHLFEKIQVEELPATQNGERQEKEIERANRSSISRRLVFISMLGAVLLFGALGAFFYFREDSPKTLNSAAPELKLKFVSASSSVKTLAVFPLKSADENFAAAFAGDLSVRLGSFNKFSVKPFALVRESIQRNAPLATDFVLDGEIEVRNNLFGGRVRLLEAKTNGQIWSGKFEFDNLVQLHDAIANQISREIQNQLTPDEREHLAKRLPTNPAAYENFQTGSILWRKRLDGKVYFRRAIELDQSFARAYVALASAKMMEGVKDSPAAKEAEQLLQKAFELDDNLAEAYAVQGFMRIFHYHDWEGAEKSLRNALELDAASVNARHWLAVLYSIRRRLPEAKSEMQKALELDPINPTLLADLGQLHYFAGEKELANEYCRKALAIEPTHGFSTQYLEKIDNSQQAITNKEALLNQLHQASEKNDFALPYINVDPLYDSLRDEPRYREILRKMNLN